MTGCAVTVAWLGSPQASQAASVSLSRQLNALGTPRSGNGARSATGSLVEHPLKTSLDTLAEAMEGTVVHPANPKTALSVRAMLTASIGALELLPDRGDPFSIRDWIENDSGSGFLFLTSRGDQHASLRGLISTWLEIAVNALLSFPRDDGRRIWIVLDESPTLHQLLQPGLAESRQFGGCFVLGVQAFSALRDLYGRDGGGDRLRPLRHPRGAPLPFVREQLTPWSGDATFSVVGLHQFHQDSVAPKGGRRGGLHPASAGPRAVCARGLAQQEGRPCLGAADPAEACQETQDCLAAAARALAAESADPGFSVASLRPGATATRRRRR